MKSSKTFYNISGNSVTLGNNSLTSSNSNEKNLRNYKFLKIAFGILITLLIIQLIIILLISLKNHSYHASNKTESGRIIRLNNTYWNNFHLPEFAKPEQYLITLQLLKEAFSLEEHDILNQFYGNVLITFVMKSDSNFLVLNSKQHKIKSIEIKHLLSNIYEQYIQVVKVIDDNFYEQLIIVFNETLVKSGKYSVNITYSGSISVSEDGLIRTFYRSNLLNKTYDILYSQLEPTGARTMFPCFDEPDKKALFSVKIIHNTKYTALSNMPLKKKDRINKCDLIYPDDTILNSLPITLSTFNSTLIFMSTYLVALVLMEDYEKIERERKPNYNVAIWGPLGFNLTGVISLNFAINTENFFETLLNYSSPLPKTDHIYIPNFLFGAMENWGLITYRDFHLLISPKYGNIFAEPAYTTIAHELAHIWFGNWVTMKSWSDLWLNEGFATYFSTLAYYKEFNFTSKRIRENDVLRIREILEEDGKLSSFPVRSDEIKLSEIFNSFTYYKGSAMLAWLNNIMGEVNFMTGIRSYINKYAQGNPTVEQFFAEMELQRPKSVTFNESFYDFFIPWLNQVGYPVLTVHYDSLNKLILLSQHSILQNFTKYQIWPIIINLKLDANLYNETIYVRECVKINLTVSENGFLLLNSDGYSYVRVNYDPYLWRQIIKNIKENNGKIKEVDKIVLFDDVFFFAEAGSISLSIMRDFVDTLVNETNIVPWNMFYSKVIFKMHFLFSEDKAYIKWSNYVRKLSEKALTKAFQINTSVSLHITEESYQKQIYALNCMINNPRIIDFVSNKFLEWIRSPNIILLPKHLTVIILYYGIRENDKEEYWMKMWNMMIEIDGASTVDKDQIAQGLTGTTRIYRLNRLVKYILTPGTHNSAASKQYFFNRVIKWLMKSNNGMIALNQWIASNSEEIKNNAFGNNIPNDKKQLYLQVLVGTVASVAYDINVIKPLLKLFSNNESIIELVEKNKRWREDIGKNLLKYV